MNEQLRKAIQEATMVKRGLESNIAGNGFEFYVPEVEHLASQAKLLRVIELLVKQRDRKTYTDNQWHNKELREFDDAELIAALGERSET